eukprot:TRINITY_DN1729_c0_g1_i1.p1 TRINITY_DN1729_c0_g1~~TRINITY_DN1729_c0_g1_i1.p1  ORF type:complete len:454 (-),score=86.80 TRINITY_DN1729_c0_g1_i1:26-1321(-)
MNSSKLNCITVGSTLESNMNQEAEMNFAQPYLEGMGCGFDIMMDFSFDEFGINNDTFGNKNTNGADAQKHGVSGYMGTHATMSEANGFEDNQFATMAQFENIGDSSGTYFVNEPALGDTSTGGFGEMGSFDYDFSVMPPVLDFIGGGFESWPEEPECKKRPREEPAQDPQLDFYQSEKKRKTEENYNQDQDATLRPVQEIEFVPDFSLIVGQHPSEELVYKRLVKPFPSVMLREASIYNQTPDLFVNVSLVKYENKESMNDILTGSIYTPIANGNYASFKKLKITETSLKFDKAAFQICFSLYRRVGTLYEPMNVASYTKPFLVYSHTGYLKPSNVRKRRKTSAPPVLNEIVPAIGRQSGGDRCVLIGSNFVDSEKLVVRFGETVIRPQFHEAGCLIITTPPCYSNQVQVTVSNDGEHFCSIIHFFLKENT